MDFAKLLQRQFLPILEKAPLALCIVSADAAPVYLNRAASRLLSFSVDQSPLAMGEICHLLDSEGNAFRLTDELRMIMDKRETTTMAGLSLKGRETSGDITLTVIPIPLPEGPSGGGILIFEDIAGKSAQLHDALCDEVKTLKAEVLDGKRRLKTVSRRLLDIQESERRRISRELHDEIGQALTALKITLQTVERDVSSAAIKQRLQSGIGIVDRLMDQVRNLSLDLRPSLLDDLGLKSALRWYTDKKRQDAGLEISLKTEIPDTGFGAELDMVCFRVVQEALTNVVRHASASSVGILISANESELRLEIEDDGIGFDLAEARRAAYEGRSLGLLGMLERVKLADGAIKIESSKGAGTRIRVLMPLAPPELHENP